MADNEGASRDKEQSLNFFSAKFDPLRALYTKDLKPPIPSIQVFNNLGEYARVIKEGKPKTVEKDPRKKASLVCTTSKRTRNLKPEYKPPDISTRLKAIASTRVVQKDLLSNEKRGSISCQDEGGLSKDKKQNALGFGRGQSGKKKYMNVLEKMDACATGPLSILYKCLDKRYKVQVWIRKYKGLRSVLTGYVIAFDKHMNLALMDVDEVYTTEEYHRKECCTKEEKPTKKKKKKKKKPKSRLIQIKENLRDTDKKEYVSVGFTSPCDKINVKTVPELNENSMPHVQESTTAQDADGTGLTTVGDLNRPFKSLKADYNKYQTEFKSGEEVTDSIMKDEETTSSLSSVTTKECDKTLSADQLVALSRQWADEQEQERKEALDSQQQIIQTVDTEAPMDQGSEQTGYLFSHDLKVRVPAHEDLESQDMEFTVVGIFQPVLSTVENNEDKSAMLPENLEIHVPLLVSNTIDKNEEMKDLALELDKPVKPVLTELVSEPVLHGEDVDGDFNEQVKQLDKPDVPVIEPVLHNTDIDGDSNDQVVQLDKPGVPVIDPFFQNTDIDGDSNDQVVQLDKPGVPVIDPFFQNTDIDGDSNDQVMQLDKPDVPVLEPVLHKTNIDEEAKDKVVQSDSVVMPTAETCSEIIEQDGNTAQKDEYFAAETRLTDGKAVICETSFNERQSLPVCDGSNITGKPDTGFLPPVSCAIDENSVICEKKSKELKISRNLSALKPEKSNVESLNEVSCISEGKEIGERVLEEFDAQVEPEEKAKSMHSREPKSTKQSKTEGNVIEGEDVKKLKEKCTTYDNENEYKEHSENHIGKMNQGMEYCEKGEVERKDLSTALELRSMTSSEERSVSVDNILTLLSWDEDSAVRESGVQGKTCENDDGESAKEKNESWKLESLSGESKTKKGMEANIGCVVTDPKGENQPCKSKDGDFHKGPEESGPCELLSSVQKNDAVADPGVGDEPYGVEADPVESPCESLSVVKTNDAVADPGVGDDPDGAEADAEENSPCKSLSSVQKNDAVADQGVGDEPYGVEADPVESPCESLSVVKTNDAVEEPDEDKPLESEKEEGEITSSDDEEPSQNTQPQVDQPKHGGTKTGNPKKLSVWERLGFKEKARKEESTRRGEGENYEKKRRDERKQDTRRSKDDEKKDKDRRRSTSGEHTRKEESGRKKEGKERRDMKTGGRKGSVGSQQGSSREKDVGMKRRERLSTRCGERDSVRSVSPLRKDRERRDDRKKTEQRVGIGHVVKDGTERPSRDAVSSTDKTREKVEGKVDGKSRERRPSSREEKDGQRNEGRLKLRVIPRDEAGTERPKKDKERKRSGEIEKGLKVSSTEIKRNQGKQTGISSDGGKHAKKSKEKKSDGVKEWLLTKNEIKKDERKERNLQLQGDSERRSKKDTGRDMQARESMHSKEKKEATSSRIPGEPQGDQPKKTRSSDVRQLVLKEFSSNQKKAKEVIKEKKTIEISKPEKSVHRSTDQKKHRHSKGEGSELKPVKSKTSDQLQGTHPRGRRQEDRLSNRSKHKDTKLSRAQETQSGKGTDLAKQIDANRLGNTERENNNQRPSTCVKSAEKLTSLEKTKAEKTDVQQVKVGLLPTPVLEMKTTSGPGRLKDCSTVRPYNIGNTSSESSKMKRNEKKAQKSSETRSKRKRPTENGRGEMKRQKRTEISGKNSQKLSNPQEQFKDATRKKEKSDSEPIVKSTRETTGSDSRLSKKDMGGESGKGICTARRIEVGKGKYLEFKRRHVNQLFVRGDNIVMIGYAT